MAKWAILVGISSYPNAPRGNTFEELRACVQDVEHIRDVLCSRWGFELDNVTTLTSPLLDNSSCLPSYQNILQAISSTFIKASTGDVVYLHFSAATAPVDCMFPPIRTTPITGASDNVILPYDFFLNRKCLGDLEIAFLLRRYVARGVEVALMIDGRRRSPGYDVIIRSQEEDLKSVSQGIWSQQGYRTWLQSPEPRVSFSHVWFSSDNEYFENDSQTWHGPLTYFLLRYLRAEVALNYTCRTLIMHLGGSLTSQFAHSLETGADSLIARGCMETPFLGGTLSDAPRIALSPTEYQYFLESLSDENLLKKSVKLSLSSPFGQNTTSASDNPNSPMEDLSNNDDVLIRLILTPDQHADLYKSYISLRYYAPALSDGFEVFLLGAYGRDGDKYPRVPYFSEGVLHLVSGDYAVIRVASLLGQQAFVRVLCFDSSFGVFQVYPMTNTSTPEIAPYSILDDDVQAEPYNQVRYMHEIVIHLQLFISSRSRRTKQPREVTEALKIIVSSEPFHNQRAIEMPPIRDEEYLVNHPDPVSSSLLNRRKDNQKANGIDTRLIKPDSGENQIGFLEDMRSTANLARSSYTINYVLHADDESFLSTRSDFT